MDMGEERVERFPWLLVILTPLLIGFIGPIWQLLIPSFPYWINNSLGESICNIGLTTAPFLVLLLTAPLYRIRALRERLGIKTLAYLYISSIVASYFINYPWAIGQRYLYASRYTEGELGATVIPDFMAPPPEVCKVLATGGPIDWSAWATPIMWFWLHNITMGLFMLSVATLFRRLWIDVEKVPFPQTLVAYELARNNLRERGWGKLFIIGVVIGLAFQIPVTFTGIFPWFPDIYGVKYRTCPHLTRWIGGDEPLGAIPGMMSMNYNPPVVAMAYMAPLSVLLSTWFFALVYIISVQVAYYMGYYTGITDIGTCGRFWCHPSPTTDPPLKFGAIAIGALIMMGIMHLILNRGYLAETFSAVFKGSSGAEEEKEAMSYKTIFIMMAVTFIATIAFWMWSTLSFIDALFLPITAFCVWYPMTRIYGLAGAYWRSADKGLVFFRLLHPTCHSPPTTQEYLIYRTAVQSCSDTPSYPWGGAAFSTFAAYKFADLAGLSARNTFKTLLVALLIAPITSHISFIWLLHTVGGEHIGIWKSWFEPIGERIARIPDWWIHTPASEPWVEYAVLGAVLMAALSWLHARFVWFPLNPIGYLLGTTAASALFGLWIPFFVAWVLKVITLRIGGAKLYENYGVPVASGAVTGCIIGMVLGGLIWIVRYFVPF
ncbi:hypothetical protein DRO57_03305 [Candidatus Bathyarchaeota archaeon]|nr:MAG: hypothetical protein DRO57_03305 [Candidatus Bathyarchaeota archaeon]